MCYRYSNTQKLVNDLFEERLTAEQKEQAYFYHANAFDKAPRPVITQQHPDQVQFFDWGLVPHWTKSQEHATKAAISNSNARSETVFDLPSFRSYIPNNRCIIPATGFFEHRHVHSGGKDVAFPYHIEVLDEDKKPTAFFFAGIYSKWNERFSFSMLTTKANEKMQYIHNNPKNPHRMPVILSKEEALTWLTSHLPKSEMARFFEPYPHDAMQGCTISKDITSRKLDPNREETLMPVDYLLSELQAHV